MPYLFLIETLSAGYYLWREGGRVAGKWLGIDFDAARELCVWLAIFVVSCMQSCVLELCVCTFDLSRWWCSVCDRESCSHLVWRVGCGYAFAILLLFLIPFG